MSDAAAVPEEVCAEMAARLEDCRRKLARSVTVRLAERALLGAALLGVRTALTTAELAAMADDPAWRLWREQDDARGELLRRWAAADPPVVVWPAEARLALAGVGRGLT